MAKNSPFSSGLEGAMARYRIMAIWAGVMSLLLWFVQVPIHTFSHNTSLQNKLVWIALVHGYTYPIYVLTAFQYCVKSRKSFTTTIVFILAGILPIASFIAERRAVRDYETLTSRRNSASE